MASMTQGHRLACRLVNDAAEQNMLSPLFFSTRNTNAGVVMLKNLNILPLLMTPGHRGPHLV